MSDRRKRGTYDIAAERVALCGQPWGYGAVARRVNDSGGMICMALAFSR